MAIPNPNPNIADGIKRDNKTYSSNKIESLISTALGGILKKTSITATTSANGNVIQPFPISNGVVVSAIRTDDDAIVIPYIDASSTGTNYMFNVCAVTSGHAPIASTEVTIDIYYLDVPVTVTP